MNSKRRKPLNTRLEWLGRHLSRLPRLDRLQTLEKAKIVARSSAAEGKNSERDAGIMTRGSAEFEARQSLFEANIRLVIFIANRYASEEVDLNDLVQDGCLGLSRAIEKYDPSLGYTFATYAIWWIRREIVRSIRGQVRQIRLPDSIWLKASKMKRAEVEWMNAYGYAPSIREIAKYVGMSVKEVQWLKESIPKEVSLDKSIVLGDRDIAKDIFLIDALAWQGTSPEEYAEDSEGESEYERLLGALTPNQAQVVRLRQEEVPVTEIARQLKVSTQRVSELEKKAVYRLRKVVPLETRQRLHIS